MTAVTVWKDGTWIRWASLDAHYAENEPNWLCTIPFHEPRRSRVSDLCAEKWVRIMADYDADGIWNIRGAAEPADLLPISGVLRQRLLAWQRRYDKECEDYLPVAERTTEFDLADFSQEGLKIAQAIKAELPDWTVLYFDEVKSPKGQAPNQDRSAFEYEISRVDT